ncbi:hypothetical protein JK169_14100 [Acetobacter persici]|nr:hypothetical protein [Acetobacter persici]MBS1002118.1 hypothetical protein [Acetobacter persici]
MTDQMHDQRIQSLLDAVGGVLEAAYVDEKSARTVIKALEQTRQLVESEMVSLSRRVTTTIDTSAEETATRAAGLLQEKFSEANRRADEAAERYRHAAQWLNLKLIGVALFIQVCVLVGGWFFVQRTVPSSAEIDARRTEIQQMDANITFLKQKGGKLQFTQCEGSNREKYLCIRTNEGQYPNAFANNDGNGNATYRIPFGY